MYLDLSCALGECGVGWKEREVHPKQLPVEYWTWESSRRMWLQLAIASLTHTQGNVSSKALLHHVFNWDW